MADLKSSLDASQHETNEQIKVVFGVVIVAGSVNLISGLFR